MKKPTMWIVVVFVLSGTQVMASCHRDDDTYQDIFNIRFVVNNASDRWMYLWMGHPNYGEDNGNLNLKPHSSATAMGCSSGGTGYGVTGIILTQGKDVLYTFDVERPLGYSPDNGWVTMHTWKGSCYVAYGDTNDVTPGKPTTFNMRKMSPKAWWAVARARVRIDCV